MFAPRVKAPQAKTASQTTPTRAPKPPQRTPVAPDRPSGPETRPPLLQRKLAIGRINDPLEHEADRIAEQVMCSAAPEAAIIPALLSDNRSEQGKRQNGPVGSAKAITPGASSHIRDVLRTPGEPLSASLRTYFEPSFGCDLSKVRVHTDDVAASAAGSITAQAFALGGDVAFARGAYRPDTNDGQRLIAHELAHVVQSAYGADPTVIRREPNAEQPAPTIISEVWLVDGRPVVVVESGGQRTAFYKRSSSDLKGRQKGHAGPQKDDWVPFDGFTVLRKPGKKDATVIDGYFEKNQYYRGMAPTDSTYGYGNAKNLSTSKWLQKETLPPAQPAEWRFVQQQLQALKVPVHTELPLERGANAPAPLAPLAKTMGGEISDKTPGPQRGTVTPEEEAGPTTPVTTPGTKTTTPEGRSVTSGSRKTGGGSGFGLIGGGLLGAAGAAFALALPQLKLYLARVTGLEEKWSAQQQKAVVEAISALTWKYNVLILNQINKINGEKKAGRQVLLHVVVDTEWVSTDYGPAQTKVEVFSYDVLFEGDTPIEWPVFQPKRSFLGNLFNSPRTSIRRQSYDIPL